MMNYQIQGNVYLKKKFLLIKQYHIQIEKIYEIVKEGRIFDVSSDGHCGPRAVAAGLDVLRNRNQNIPVYNYKDIRKLLPDTEEYKIYKTPNEGKWEWFQDKCFTEIANILNIPIILVNQSETGQKNIL